MNETNMRIAIINSRGPTQKIEQGDPLAISKEQFGKKTGGAMLKAAELAGSLNERGHDTAMLFYEGEGEEGWDGWNGSSDVRYIKPSEEHIRRAQQLKDEHGLRDHEADVAELALGLLLLDIQGDFDVIDIRGFGIFLWHAFTRDFILDKLKTPVVWTPAGEGVFEDLKPSTKHYSMVAPLSEAMRRQAISYGFKEEQVHAIPNAVDAEFFKPDQSLRESTRNELGISEGQPVFTYVGRIDSTKKVDLLLEAWKKLRAETATEPVLLIVGEPQHGQYQWEKFYEDLQRNGQGQGVICLGAQSREGVKKYLNISDFFAFPSQREGMAGSIMEASAMGVVPLLDRQTSGNIDLAQGTGLFFDRGESDTETVKAIYQQLQIATQLFASPDFSSLRVANRERMREQFSWDKKVKRYEALFRKAMAGVKGNE